MTSVTRTSYTPPGDSGLEVTLVSLEYAVATFCQLELPPCTHSEVRGDRKPVQQAVIKLCKQL